MENKERRVSEEHAIVQITQKAIVISSDHKVLLLQNSDGSWELPGGRLNVNESWEEGLRREVFEETGLDNFTICGVAGVGNWKSSRNNGLRYGVFFCCSVDGVFVPRLSHEHSAYLWIKECDLATHKFHLSFVHEIISRAFCWK